ncbi:MAG: hypothetical protein EB084_14785 [Proteobacteria bacterium]|nr:hypothetical protein [Pseudomonadota bacterium]
MNPRRTPAVGRPPSRRLLRLIAHLVALSITFVGALACGARGVDPQRSPARVTSLSASFPAQRVHLEVGLEAPEAALWQVWYAADEGAVVIDLRNVDLAGARVPSLGPDTLVRGFELRTPNFTSAQWVIKLAYAVPTSKIHAALNGAALTVDIDRAYVEEQALQVTRNATWRRHEIRTRDDYSLINEVEVTLTDGVALRIANAKESLTTVEDPTEMARRKGALVLINGGFFRYGGGPLGLIIDEGRVLVPHVARRPPRTAIGLTPSGEVLMNRVEVKDGHPIAIDGTADWSRVRIGLGGGPRLVRDGRVALTIDEEALGRSGNDITRKAGRTALARLRNGHLLLVTISGYRDNHAQGWQLPQLAAWLVERGAVDAMGLDGGGSVAMVVDGALVSRPPARDGSQRKVANGLMLTDTSPPLLPAAVQVTAALHRLKADPSASTKVVAMVTTAGGKPAADGTPVYFSSSSGVITPVAHTTKGRAIAMFTPARAIGPARVIAYAGLVYGQDEIAVEGGPPRRLAARALEVPASRPIDVAGLSPATPAPDRPGPQPTTIAPASRAFKIEALVVDAFGNALPDQEVEVRSSGSPPSRARTGSDGIARLTVTPPSDTKVIELVSAPLPAMQITLP